MAALHSDNVLIILDSALEVLCLRHHQPFAQLAILQRIISLV